MIFSNKAILIYISVFNFKILKIFLICSSFNLDLFKKFNQVIIFTASSNVILPFS